MRWFKIHVSATLTILGGWYLHDATLKNDLGWVVAMAMVVMLSMYNLREAIFSEH